MSNFDSMQAPSIEHRGNMCRLCLEIGVASAAVHFCWVHAYHRSTDNLRGAGSYRLDLGKHHQRIDPI